MYCTNCDIGSHRIPVKSQKVVKIKYCLPQQDDVGFLQCVKAKRTAHVRKSGHQDLVLSRHTHENDRTAPAPKEHDINESFEMASCPYRYPFLGASFVPKKIVVVDYLILYGFN